MHPFINGVLDCKYIYIYKPKLKEPSCNRIRKPLFVSIN